MRIELLIDGPAFWNRLEADLALARDRIFAQTLSFEADSAGLPLAAALIRSRAMDRRIVVDEFTRHVVSDKFIYHPRNLADRDLRREVRETRRMMEDLEAAGVGVRFTNKAGFLYHRFPIRNHKKLVTVDGDLAYLGGINFSAHNFAWHDLMLRIADPRFTSFVDEDFELTWGGVQQSTARAFDGVTLHVLSGRANEEQFGFLLDAIDGARREIFVESPYLGPPFSEALRRASLRGLRVTIVTPEINNWKLCQDHILWKAETAPIDLRFYPGRMIHMKAMLIDGDLLILGSANFELWSYRFQQEYVCAVTDAGAIEQFRERVMRPDLALARPVDRTIGAVRGPIADLQLEWLERLALAANGRAPGRRVDPDVAGTRTPSHDDAP